MTKKELVTFEETEVGTLSEDALAMMAKDAETYQDDVSPDDIMLPRLSILQSGSKQVKKSEPEYIKGAEEGDLFNNLTSEFVKGDEGVLFIPCKRRVVYIEWRDRKEGGGLAAHYGTDSTEFDNCTNIKENKGKHISERGNEIVKTYEVFGYVVDLQKKKASEIVMSLSKSQVKKMKKWNTLIRCLSDKTTGKQLPEYAGVYKITTVPESNDMGSWFNYEIKFVNYTLAIPEMGVSLYNKAKDFASIVKEEQVNAKYEETSEEDSDKI